MKLLRILTLCWIIGLALWPTALSAGDNAIVTITAQPWSSGDCPTGFTFNAVSSYEVQLAWIPGGNTTETIVRGAYARWPASPTDGFEVYTGNGSSTSHWLTTDVMILSDEGIYYRAWGLVVGGNYSLCYASGSIIGGENVNVMGIGLIGLLPLGLMALSMAWFKITSKDGWPIMIGAGLAWLAMGAYGFSKTATAWDIYQIIGAISIAMLVLCMLLSYAGAQARQEAIQAKVKVEINQPKSYKERFEEYEKRTGAKTRSEREAEAEDRLNRKLRRRLE